MPVEEEASIAEEDTPEEEFDDVAPTDAARVSSVAPQAQTTIAAAPTIKTSLRRILRLEIITIASATPHLLGEHAG